MIPVTTKGLSPVRHVLANGAAIIAKESHTTAAITITASFQAGNIYDPADRPGVAHFLSKVIDRGTETRPAEVIADELDGRGVTLNVSANRHVILLTCTCLSEDFRVVLELLSDISRRPTLPDEEVEKRRGEIITALRQDQDNPAVVAVENLMELLYGATHPYGRRSKGTIQTVEAIDRAALVQFHRARFSPGSLALVVVGDIEAPEAIDVAASAFGDWNLPSTELMKLPDPPAITSRQRRVLAMMNKAQADIAYGFTSVARQDPDYHAYWIMNNILGQYGLGGRLGDSIRERQGMAYYAFSSLDANVIKGPLMIRAGVSPANVDRAIRSIEEEIDKLAASGATSEELGDSKRYLIGSIPRMLETNSSIAAFLLTMEQFGLGLDYDVRLPDLLGAVTLDDVNNASRRVLSSSRGSVTVAGPYAGNTQM